MQPESSVPQEPQTPASEPAVKETAPRKPIGLIVLIVLSLLAAAGLGYWGFQANTNLKAAQDSLATLQGKYDTLKAENDTLVSDLAQTNTELEQVNADIAKTQETLKATKSKLTEANSHISTLKSKKEKAVKYVEVFQNLMLADTDTERLQAFFIILAFSDKEVSNLFMAYTKSQNTADLEKWLSYVLTTTKDILTK